MPIVFPSNPANGQIFTNENVTYTYYTNKGYWKSSKVLWPATRETLIINTGSIGVNSSNTANINFDSGFLVVSVATSHSAWVRLYSNNSARINDASRPLNQDPAGGSGVVFEAITTGNTLLSVGPAVYGVNTDNPISNTVYVRTTNLTGQTQDIQVDLTLIKMGA